MSDNRLSWRRCRLALVLCIGICPLLATAMEVKFRLVRADAPDQLVTTACTKIDVQAELDKAKADEENAAGRPQHNGGKPVVADAQVKPKAEFDHYTNYMKGIVIDGKHPYQRMYNGSFLGRSDEIALSLADGEHTIDPGAHKFTILGGKVTTSDPSLRWTGATLDILVYPVSIIAVDGSSVRDMPAELRRLPVALRILSGSDELVPKENYLSPTATFKHLTLYMLTNTVGLGYRLVPSERHFHLTEKGVVILDAEGKASTDGGIPVENQFTITIPKVAVPVVVRGAKIHVTIGGSSGQLSFDSDPGEKKDTSKIFYAIGTIEGSEITAGSRVQVVDKFHGDLGAYPRRKVLIDARAAESHEPRILQVALPAYATDCGKPLRVRIQMVDSYDASTIPSPEVGAFIWTPPVLQDDGWLRASPSGIVNPAEWRALKIQSTTEPDTYDVIMPAVHSSVYWLRFAVDKRGYCSPNSALSADFTQGIVDTSALANLSVFCPTGRHAFFNGADLPISAVIKAPKAIPASHLRLVIKQGESEYALADQDIPALEAGCNPFHFVVDGSATGALAPGDYALSATLGSIHSNNWSVTIAKPRQHVDFPIYGTGRFSRYNVDDGSSYVNVPPSIAAANEARKIFARNAAVLGQQVDTVLLDWYGFNPLSNYQGRDSSSEIAEVEKVLRHAIALPSHEVYYYQNHFEAVHDALMKEGIGEINGVKCNLAMISLMHSVEKDVHSEMRKFQLISQIGRKFENFDGLSLVYPNTDPLGNSEVVDAGRHARMEAQNKNFKTKYGYDPPTMVGATAYISTKLKGGAIAPELVEASKKWEAWMFECNSLMGDFYAIARKAVDPIIPGLKLVNEGPGWGFTANATYPVTANAHQSPLMVWTGFSDYAYNLILEPFLRPKYLQMTGTEIWGTLFGYTGMRYNIKKHVIEHLAAGVHGFGYAGNSPLAIANSYDSKFLPEEYKEIREFLHTYGPMFRKANPRAEIGVFFPFHQTMYEIMAIENEKWKMNVGTSGAYTCMTQLALLGYDFEVVSEEMIDKGELDRFKVIIVPALHHVTAKHNDALEKFAAQGKTILLGSLSTWIPKGARKIDDDFEELGDVNTRSRDPFDVDHAWWFGQMRKKIPVLRDALQPIFLPFAKPETDHLLIQSTRAGEGRYTFIWNMLYPSFMGTPRLTGNPEYSAYRGEANEQTTMPLKESVSFPAGSATYDLLSRTLVDNSQPKDGRVSVVCDLSFTSFRIFVTLPQEISSIRLEAAGSAVLGTQFPIKVTPLDKNGNAINAAIPLRITISDAAGKTVDEFYASSMMSYEKVCSAALGFAVGKWKISVEDLLIGHRVETSIAIDKAQALPFASAVRSVPVVDVQRPDLVHDFIESRRKDGESIWILLSESQNGKRPIAEEAVKQLASIGIKAEIKSIGNPDIYSKDERIHLWQRWSEMSPAQYIEHHVLLLGGEAENALIEELQESQLLSRALTGSYPGPGRGVLTVICSPFAFNRDVLCIFGPDAIGIRAALDTLVKAAVPAGKKPDPVPVALVAGKDPGSVKAEAHAAKMDGATVQCISASSDGERIAYGTLGYAKNVFVFDGAGKALFEDKIGHINTLGMQLFPDGQRMAVSSDGFLYMREANGDLKWRINFQRGYDVKDWIDPGGRYIVLSAGNAMQVCDLDLKPLWKFDEWDKCENTQEILFGRAAHFLAAIDDGRTIVYRLTGKAPGIAGVNGDDIVFCDALTGKVQKQLPVNLPDIYAFAGASGLRTELKSFDVLKNGSCFLLIVEAGRLGPFWILLDGNLKPILTRRFEMPTYIGGSALMSEYALLDDKRLVFAVGDALCISNPAWTNCDSLITGEMMLSVVVNEKKQQIIISNSSGHVTAYGYNLKKAWDTDLGSGAHLHLMADGRIAAGTMRGEAALLDADGHLLWSRSLNRFAPPEEVERRWAQLESIPSTQQIAGVDWWERLEQNIEIGKEVVSLNGVATRAKPLTATFKGAPFGTYLVEWHYGHAKAAASLSLDFIETEKAVDGKPSVEVSRLARSAQAQEKEFVERAVLRLGDRPESVRINVQANGDQEASSTIVVRPLVFPSEDIVRMPALYRDMGSAAVLANPLAKIEIFPEPPDQWTGIWAEPFCLVNGRMFEKEAGLIGGKWFIGNNTAQISSNSAKVPCFIEITLPKKRFLSHVVVAEDPGLPRVETMTVDVFIESREMRKGLTALEMTQAKRGYWQNAIKRKGNDSFYNVFKLPKIVYTNKIRVYVLAGYSSVDEIEIYESIPEEFRRPATKEKEGADAEKHK